MVPASGLVGAREKNAHQAQELRTEKNLMLSRLPPTELKAILEISSQVGCDVREVLFATGQKIKNVYFPLTGMISLVTQLKDGSSVEAMTVGCEGFAGLPIFHGVPSARAHAMIQIKGFFLTMPSESFSRVLRQTPQLSAVLHRYSQLSQEAIAQSAACISMHLIEQRCARWLLITSDAVRSTEFPLTHEFLSQMLAVRRPGVTVAIGELERARLISHRYGRIAIIDKEGLEEAACECYRTIKDREMELLSYRGAA